ncbi:hypothetical protein QU516_06785 [Moellerella wisconsensis]|uniref:hypothetical protein n=1 Tax=Moellerella wisconsensis TaxID=158849 RepID=UPI0025B170B1|nr:hypothetical protein [Moellerella wisconsensis]WJW83110.1 hypothetical protein QU516_06785 [Moellerella wisconsensis]
MLKNFLLLSGCLFTGYISVHSLTALADNDWYVSIPESIVDMSAPWKERFKYTSVLYLTEQGFKSKIPLPFDCSVKCWVAVNTQNANNPSQPRFVDPGQPNVIFKGNTSGDALSALYHNIGSMIYTSQGTAPDRRNENIEWCGAVAVSQSGSGPSYVLLPGGECGRLPPESLSCVLLTPDILIDYGEFHKSDILDNTLDKRKNGTFKIKCDRDATVLLSLISPDEENSSNRGTRIVFDTDYDLVSYLTVNDKAALTPTPFEVTGGENGTEFKVTSELALEGEHKVVLGPFSSYAYIVLSYQ